MAKDSWVRDLRRAYPTIPPLRFFDIIANALGDDQLLNILDREEADARQEEDQFQANMAELEKRLRLSEMHHRLGIVVHHDEDLEHVQAILVHGLMMLGQKEVYAGSNVISAEKLAVNVRNKLLARFSNVKFDAALLYLVRIGVVNATGRKSTRAFALNLDGEGADTHGRQILAVVKAKLHEKK